MKKQTFLKGSLILMISAAAAKLLGAMFKIPLTNMLGGVGMSYFSCAYSLFMPVYAFTVTGISSAVARMTARSAALGMYGNIRRIRHTGLMVFSAAGLIGSAAVLLLAKPFCIYSAHTPGAVLSVAMIAPAVLFGCITAVERGCAEGMGNMYPTAVSQVIEGTVKVGAGLWLCSYAASHSSQIMRIFPSVHDVRALASAAGILGVTLSSLGAVLFFMIFRIPRKGLPDTSSHMQSRREIAGELISSALPIGMSAVVTNLTALIDMWTVIGCLSRFGCRIPAPFGVDESELPQFIYGSFAGIALTIFNLVPSVTNMLGKGALTCVTDAWEKKDRSALVRSTSQALTLSMLMSVPAAAGIAALAPEILAFLYPDQTDEAAVCINSLRLLMPGMVCLCVSYPVFSMLQAVGKPSSPLKIMLAGTIVKLAGNAVLIPQIGVDGAAVATSVCYIIILASALWTYSRAVGMHIKAGPIPGIVYSGVMCGASALLMSEMLSRNGTGPACRLIVSTAAGGTVYLLFLWLSAGKSIKQAHSLRT